MSLLDPAQRSQAGSKQQARILAGEQAEPQTLLQSSWRDYVYAEVWNRPGLDLRARYLVSLAGEACEGARPDILDPLVKGALSNNEISLLELREAALHLAVYSGWSHGIALDESISRVEKALGLEPAEIPPLRAEPWDPEQRIADGTKSFADTMIFTPPPPVVPYFEAGILNFVFGEMWERPALDQRSRRWVTLVGVANSCARIPIRTHTYAAMASGNASAEEMHEFVLQYAVYCGWPKASVMQAAVFDMAKLVAEGKPYED